MSHKITLTWNGIRHIHYFDSQIKALVFATSQVLENTFNEILIEEVEEK